MNNEAKAPWVVQQFGQSATTSRHRSEELARKEYARRVRRNPDLLFVVIPPPPPAEPAAQAEQNHDLLHHNGRFAGTCGRCAAEAQAFEAERARVEVSDRQGHKGTVPVCSSCGSEPGKYRQGITRPAAYIGENCRRAQDGFHWDELCLCGHTRLYHGNREGRGDGSCVAFHGVPCIGFAAWVRS